MTWRYLDVPEPAPVAHWFPSPDSPSLCGRTGPSVPTLPDDDTPTDHRSNCGRCAGELTHTAKED